MKPQNYVMTNLISKGSDNRITLKPISMSNRYSTLNAKEAAHYNTQERSVRKFDSFRQHSHMELKNQANQSLPALDKGMRCTMQIGDKRSEGSPEGSLHSSRFDLKKVLKNQTSYHDQ